MYIGFTDEYGSRVILFVCVSDGPHDKTKTAETKVAKLGTGIVHHGTSPANEYLVKGHGHRIKKCRSRDETAVRRRLVAL